MTRTPCASSLSAGMVKTESCPTGKTCEDGPFTIHQQDLGTYNHTFCTGDAAFIVSSTKYLSTMSVIFCSSQNYQENFVWAYTILLGMYEHVVVTLFSTARSVGLYVT